MEYSINKVAKMSKVSTRTLRYYDEIGLLSPCRISNGYRIYGKKEIDLLQQILLYREFGVSLQQIKTILHSSSYDKEKILNTHLQFLMQEKTRINLLIETVSKTIQEMKGEIKMQDKEKFEGFKQRIIEENEAKYGAELREKYGENAILESNAKVKAMSEDDWNTAQKLSETINQMLKKAFEIGNPAGELAQEMCDLHRQWLCMFWKEGTYSKQAHQILAESYVYDERFRAYYDKIAVGCAEFLRDAIGIYCRH